MEVEPVTVDDEGDSEWLLGAHETERFILSAMPSPSTVWGHLIWCTLLLGRSPPSLCSIPDALATSGGCE